MDTGLAGRVVVVTGATVNIGRAAVLAFAAERAKVVVVGRDEATGRTVVERALAAGAEAARWRRCDVTDDAQVQALRTRVIEEFSTVDVLVNNVGGNTDLGPFVESEPAQWRADIDLTLTSVLLCTRRFLPDMVARRSGRIINIGSMSGVIGDPYLAVYSAAKAAVHGFTRVLAVEVGEYGVTVNAIAPYATRPDDPDEPSSAGSRFHPELGLMRTLSPAKAAWRGRIFKEGLLPQKVARASQVASAAVYLASDTAGYITGEILHIDGGVRWSSGHGGTPPA
jgi:2-hydroxycyclohexanecarboxyl-CoA dehydrogenase